MVRVQFTRAWAAHRGGDVAEVSGNLAQTLVQVGVARYVQVAAQRAPEEAPTMRPAATQLAQPSASGEVRPMEAPTPVPALPELDDLQAYSMVQLRDLARRIGATPRRSKDEQLAAIIDAYGAQ